MRRWKNECTNEFQTFLVDSPAEQLCSVGLTELREIVCRDDHPVERTGLDDSTLQPFSIDPASHFIGTDMQRFRETIQVEPIPSHLGSRPQTVKSGSDGAVRAAQKYGDFFERKPSG